MNFNHLFLGLFVGLFVGVIYGSIGMYMYENTFIFSLKPHGTNIYELNVIFNNDEISDIFNNIINNKTDYVLRCEHKICHSDNTLIQFMNAIGKERLLVEIVKQQPKLLSELVDDHITCNSDKQKIFEFACDLQFKLICTTIIAFIVTFLLVISASKCTRRTK